MTRRQDQQAAKGTPGTPGRQSLTRALARAVGRAVVWTACLAVGFLAVLALAAEGAVTAALNTVPGISAGPSAGPSAARHAVQADTGRLVASGQCWTGPQPRDVTYPGSVLVVKDVHGEPRAVRKAHLVDPALDQIFKGRNHHLTVLAFCR